MKSRYAVVFLAALVASCGNPMRTEGDDKAVEIRNEKARSDRYQGIKGTYEGCLYSGSAPSEKCDRADEFRATMVINPVIKQDGTYADGTARMRSRLSGRLKMTDVIGDADYVTMSGDYTEFGELQLTSGGNAAGAVEGGDKSAAPVSIAVQGGVKGNVMNIEVIKRESVWRKFAAKRVSKDALGPSESDEQELRDRLLKIYSGIHGTYEGVIGGHRGYKVSIMLLMSDGMRSGPGVPMPMLHGVFDRLDVSDGGTAGRRQLAVSFNSVRDEIFMDAVGVSASGILSMRGTLRDRVLDVHVVDRFGDVGRLTAKALR